MSDNGRNPWVVFGAIVGGALVGGGIVYAVTRPKITALEARVAELEARNVDMNQKIYTIEGTLESFRGYVVDLSRRLEDQNRQTVEEYDGIIQRLEHISGQVQDEELRQLVQELLATARLRQQGRLQVVPVRPDFVAIN